MAAGCAQTDWATIGGAAGTFCVTDKSPRTCAVTQNDAVATVDRIEADRATDGSSDTERPDQTAVAQIVSPRALLEAVATATSSPSP